MQATVHVNKIPFFSFHFSLKTIFWSWEKDDNFDNLISNADVCAGAIQWVDIRGNPVSVSSEWTGNDRLRQKACLVEKGDIVGHVDELLFRDP